MNFFHPRRGKCSFEEMMTEIQTYLREDPNSEYKLMIGTDSMTRYKETVFVTAIIVQRVGKGALFFYSRRPHRQLKDLRYRIYRETEYSLSCVDLLKDQGFFRMFSDVPMEIHLDIGQQGETRKVIQEVVGWVTAVGYQAKIKPESYAASAVADRFTR